MFAVATRHYLHHQLRVEYHRDRSLDRSCSCCTQPTCCDSLRVTTCVHMHSPMTRRSTVFVNCPAFQLSRSRCLHESTMSLCGYGATVYSSAPLKRKSSDVQQVGNSTRFPRFQRVLARTSLPCRLCTGPGYLSRCRRHYEDPRFEDSVVLCCCTSTDPQHAQLHSTAGISGHVAGSVPA